MYIENICVYTYICVYRCIYYKFVTEACTIQTHLNQACFETVESNFFKESNILYFAL